jgi:hypothetical protein
MSGFLNVARNAEFETGLFDIIVERLLCCSRLMKSACISTDTKINNNEEQIRNYLLEHYLNNDNINVGMGLVPLYLRFIPEAPEKFTFETNTYVGRIDIKVVTENWFKCSSDYYIVECKRIDGSNDLNGKYVTEGISRFVVAPVKYKSPHKRNIMFGFVVSAISITENVLKIDDLQRTILKEAIKTGLHEIKRDTNEYCVHSGLYFTGGSELEIKHLFFDFSPILS